MGISEMNADEMIGFYRFSDMYRQYNSMFTNLLDNNKQLFDEGFSQAHQWTTDYLGWVKHLEEQLTSLGKDVGALQNNLFSFKVKNKLGFYTNNDRSINHLRSLIAKLGADIAEKNLDLSMMIRRYDETRQY
jgi:hypothetical protein